ncbi:hypothetical protein Ga0123461_1316 [Mariprofundus aestuarium]|uniref:Uncharacterized protein n=1 Tax=Mariprofundus aestuarium TaxID=1921086 RepID=A0A2K8KXW7_MARES|nr:hypothetical protein [Mariprofundus aestuarium]ATX79733.1 hypothetical protein Ga0123461_1316 [Mariprofundus aestuarium]
MQLRRWRQSDIVFLATVSVVLFASPANAGCTWKFDWYCSDCAKIGGQTTGTHGGYASESACESARDQVKSPVSAMSCDRVGWCDEPSKPPSSPQTNIENRGGSYTPSQPDYGAQQRMAEESRRQEEARRQAERERKAREQRAFDKAKSDTLRTLKGSSSSSSSKDPVSTLKLKSGTPTFSIKGNPDGQLHLKSPSAVKLKNPENAVADPSFFTRPKARLHIRYVPNPMQAPKGTWLRYVKSDRANLILDALEMGKGDLDKAIGYLDGQIIRHGSHRAASSALGYLEGLRTSYIAVGAEYRKKSRKQGQQVTVESKALLQAILAASGVRKWPGPTNPNPAAKPLNPDDWRVKRANKLLTALKAAPGDLEKSYKILRSDREIIVAADAEYYLRGVFAYWDFLADQGGKK